MRCGSKWTAARYLRSFMKNYSGYFLEEIKITSSDNIGEKIKNKGIRGGDLLFWQNSNGLVYHAGIIVRIKDKKEVRFAANTTNRWDESLNIKKGETIYILKWNMIKNTYF